MIRYALIGFAVLVVFAISLVVLMPIGFPLRSANIERAGISYTTAEGTLYSSRISGVEAFGQPIGDVVLRLRPMSLLGGTLRYDVQWGGPSGRGAGEVSLGANGELGLKDVNVEQNVSALEGLMNSMRDVGGTLRVRNGNLRLQPDRCVSGSADLSSDMLTRAAEPYGRNFSDVTGTLTCVDGAFLVELESQSDVGDTLDVVAKAELTGMSEVTAEVRTNDPELAIVLGELQFQSEDGVWRYSTIRGLGG